jgi:Mor family transcriptional regulator
MGEKHPMVKLSMEDILNIISMNLAGFNRKEISKKYKISEGHYYRIIRGDTWKNF